MMDRKHRNREWAMTVLLLLAGVNWCFVAFARTDNRIVQSATVVLWLTVAFDRVMMTRNATAQKTKDNAQGLDWALAIAWFDRIHSRGDGKSAAERKLKSN